MRRLPALLILLASMTATACWQPPTTPSPLPSAAPSRLAAATPPPSPRPSEPPLPLLSIETRGGECPAGACNRLVNLDADGAIHEVIPKDRVVGMVPQEIVEALQVEMAQANYSLLQSRPFTGTCPTAVDGQETIYTFHLQTGDEEFASCTVAIDENHPLFRAVAAALAFETPSPPAP
jgi:hypothetical protein